MTRTSPGHDAPRPRPFHAAPTGPLQGAGDGAGHAGRLDPVSFRTPGPSGPFQNPARAASPGDAGSFDLARPAGSAEASGFGAGLDPSAAGSGSSTVEHADSAAADSGGKGGKRRRRGRRRGTRGSREGGEEARNGEGRRTRRRRRSRKKPASQKSEASAEEPATREARAADGEGSDGSAEPKRKRRRGSRGGRRRRKKGGGAAVEIESIPGEDDDLPEIADLPDDAELVEEERSKEKSGKKKKSKRKSSTKKKRSRRGKSDEEDDEPATPAEPEVASVILVNANEPEETRVAVVQDGKITDLQMTVRKRHSYVSDIYRGRVVNLEPAIGAAFVDFGQGRNGFLHASDVLSSYGDPDWSLSKLLTTPNPQAEWESGDEGGEGKGKREGGGRSKGGRSRGRQRQPIEKLLKKGQMVVVQITKDAIGDKGPTLTTHVSIPGRYLVLMPSLERTGVSRKIDDDRERRRLKRILSGLDIPEGMGVIVRTAGVGKTKAEIKRDLEYLLLAWQDFSRRLERGRNPAPLYQESDVAVRTMRDLFTTSTEKVVVDDEEVFQRMVEFTEKLMPEHVERLQMHKGSRPLFHGYGVEQDFERIFARRVDLPSGGSIVFDQTEALVAIDVNSGRTREEGAEFEDIALKTNLEAVDEIVRQIRLRDLGGIIVLDYIDMMRMGNRRAVERATREAFKRDRARSKIGRISQFGLLELTRQRLGPGLSKLVYENCSRCRGSGRQRTPSSRAQAILRRLGAALTLKGFTSVEVRAHPEVIEYLEKNLSKELGRLEEDSGRKLVLLAVPEQVEDSVLHYLRADGREVRPGGRRKR